jgi:nicotinate phosphoribosyltransferase
VEAIRLAEKLKDKLNAVRIDTPASRRGDLPQIVKETREELDSRGFDNVGIFVSGGLDEYNIIGLNPWVQGYGIGTSLSNAPTINFSLDIVEIEGKLIAKKGKISGKKEVLECARCGSRKVFFIGTASPKCDCGNDMQLLTKKILENGKIAGEVEEVDVIRNRVLRGLRYLNV